MMKSMDEQAYFLEDQRHKIEDAFFREKDKALIEQLRVMKQKKETRGALAEVSGIRNSAVLDKLVDLGVRPETLAAIALVPLVEVAWADGAVSKSEEQQVLAAAEKNGMAKNGIEYKILREWLAIKPPAALLDAWVHYVGALCEKLGSREIDTLRSEIIGHAKAVAEAAGGVLGMGAISKEEKAVLALMEKAFACRK
ncbi:MAG: hypothetical protein MUF22_01225 [Chitinispirillaceae bacterium]|jgi:hypothetical protein|nr:hypothetical protein [Chitinispirillaceae bacterium]